MKTITSKKQFVVIAIVAFVIINVCFWSYAVAKTVMSELEGDVSSVWNYGKHEYWLAQYPDMKHISSLEFGETIDSGVYYIDNDITVKPTEDIDVSVNKSALKIKGNVTLIIENNKTLTAKGVDANGVEGAGAGIELKQGDNLIVKGIGKIVANGGKAAKGQDGEKGKDASLDDQGSSGDSGTGGNGGGGAGAAIGTCGGQAGQGGLSVKGMDKGYGPSVDWEGRDGNNGENGFGTDNCGILKVYGNVKMDLNGGEANGEKVTYSKGGIGKYTSDGIFGEFNDAFAGGGSGGCGGYGYPAANIGTGGSGGAGAGSGGSGSITYVNFFHKWDHQYSAGAGGGSGMGYLNHESDGPRELGGLYRDSDNFLKNDGLIKDQASFGGKGHRYEKNSGGDGGNGGVTEVSGAANIVFATTLNSKGGSSDNYSGKRSIIHKVFPACECGMKNFIKYEDGTISFDVVHVPTDTILEEGISYTIVSIEEHENNQYAITIQGTSLSNNMLADESMENPGTITFTTNPLAAVKIRHLSQNLNDDKTMAADTYTEVATECYYEEVGKMAYNINAMTLEGFTALPIDQKIVEEGDNEIDVFYNRNNSTLAFREGDHGAWSRPCYTKTVCFGAIVSNFLPEDYTLAELNYKFNKWSPELTDSTEMSDEGMIFIAQWEMISDETTYTVNEYWEDECLFHQLEREYSLHQKNILKGESGTETQYVPQTYEGFEVQPFEQKIINVDGSTTLDVYYDRITPTLTIDMGEHGYMVFPGNNIYVNNICYGANINYFMSIFENFVIVEENYSLDCWTPDPDLETIIMPAHDIYIKANYRFMLETINFYLSSDACQSYLGSVDVKWGSRFRVIDSPETNECLIEFYDGNVDLRDPSKVVATPIDTLRINLRTLFGFEKYELASYFADSDCFAPLSTDSVGNVIGTVLGSGNVQLNFEQCASSCSKMSVHANTDNESLSAYHK